MEKIDKTKLVFWKTEKFLARIGKKMKKTEIHKIQNE